MTAYADLEIGLHRWDAGGYTVELRYTQPESDVETRAGRSDPAVVRFDFDGLRRVQLDAAAYGKLLTDSLFSASEAARVFAQVRSSAQSLRAILRLRLFVGPSAPELHSLRWEMLRDPEDRSPLVTGEQILFSRYLSSLDWRPVRPRRLGDLSALVVIANPCDLETATHRVGGLTLAPVDVVGELDRARGGLGSIPMQPLASGGHATLNELFAQLRNGHDVLYLVCHGALVQGEPWLWLEDEAGHVARVAGQDLVIELRKLQQCPRLVVLASCQSAGSDGACSADEGALAALGPRLAEAGVPAVLAMQGNISMETVARFMPVFFDELQRHGQIDRAMAVARGAVQKRPDWWVPTLFMRLRSGQLWYRQGFSDERGSFQKWPALLQNIRERLCTPILGSGVLQPLIGSSQEIAQRWADAYSFPMSPYQRDNLPDVAQFLAANLQQEFPRLALTEYLHEEIARRHFGGSLPEELKGKQLEALLTAAWKCYCQHHSQDQRHPREPHQVLAALPCPVYITTNPDNLLAEALTAAGRPPVVEMCHWKQDIDPFPSIYDKEPDYDPTPERPLVYHLFGHLQQRESVVVTEDDYFDYLIGVTERKDLIPERVRRLWASSGLLFLGFQLDDWDFRVLFRSIMRQEGRNRRNKYVHIAAQISPEEGRILEPDGARRYLESYFHGAAVSIYWGSAEEFLDDLGRRWDAFTRGRSV